MDDCHKPHPADPPKKLPVRTRVATTADWSVCLTWGYRLGKWYLLDVYRARLEYPDLKRAVIRLTAQWLPDWVLVERANAGLSLLQELRREIGAKFIGPHPQLDKETRLIGQSARLETGTFHIPVQAPWLDAFCNELRAFPSGRHDDQVDALTQFLEFEFNNARRLQATYGPDGRLISKPRPPGRSLRR